MKKMINMVHLEGYVYQHNLELKVSGENSKNPGTEFINGTLSIATDDAKMNVVPVHFSYVTAVTKKGKPNATFNVLKAIIDGRIGSIMEHGAENAGKVRVDTAIGLNDWYDYKTEGTPLVSTKRNEGGFVHEITDEPFRPENQRSTFEVDIVITKVTRIDPDEERGTPERMTLRGAIFDFKNAILPVEFSVTANPVARDYFESLDAGPKNPIFTKVRGSEISQTITKTTTEESAFGEPAVKTTTSSYKDFVVEWAQANIYDWDTEETILASELSEALANREVYLAEVKKRSDEYQANKTGGAAAFAKVDDGGYDF